MSKTARSDSHTDKERPLLKKRGSTALPVTTTTPLRKRAVTKPDTKATNQGNDLHPDQPEKGKTGRPRGAKNKRTVLAGNPVAAQAAIDSGLTPLQVLCHVMNILYEQGMNAWATVGKRRKRYVDIEKLKLASDIAAKAAPFIHARLSAIEIAKNMTDAELLALIHATAAEAGITLDGVSMRLPEPVGTTP